VSASTDAPEPDEARAPKLLATYATQTGRLLGTLDQIAVKAALAAEFWNGDQDAPMLRARLHEIAALAQRATAD
jgi:hypothetical protein